MKSHGAEALFFFSSCLYSLCFLPVWDEANDLTVMVMSIASSSWWGALSNWCKAHWWMTFTTLPVQPQVWTIGRQDDWNLLKTGAELCWTGRLDNLRSIPLSHNSKRGPRWRMPEGKDYLHCQPVILTQPEHCLVCLTEKVLLVGAVPHGSCDRLYVKIWKREIPVRPPQMEPLMIPLFISASLWGCLACEYFSWRQDPTGGLMSKNFAGLLSIGIWKQHHPNTCTDLKTWCSKCYLLG